MRNTQKAAAGFGLDDLCALGEAIIATPAIADNILYVRTRGHLWAFGK